MSLRITLWLNVGLLCVIGALAACDRVRVTDDDVMIIREPDVLAATADPTTAIVDVRTPEAYATGHLPNAINIYLPTIRAQDQRLATAKRIIVYDAGWSSPLSTVAAKRLMGLRYKNVLEFKGGIKDWQEAGHRLVQSLPPADVRPDTAQ